MRKELKLSKHSTPKGDLKLLWMCLDRDDSGLITVQEFAGFMRRLEANKLEYLIIACLENKPLDASGWGSAEDDASSVASFGA